MRSLRDEVDTDLWEDTRDRLHDQIYAHVSTQNQLWNHLWLPTNRLAVSQVRSQLMRSVE